MSSQIQISIPTKIYITDRHRQLVHPLPTPSIGHLTGLTCPDCPRTSTSQLQYHPPRHPNPANINWQCHIPNSNHSHGKVYSRTLQLEHLINNIRAVNARAQPPPAPGSLSGLLNLTHEAPDHLKNKPTGQLCPGYLGKTGATHHSSNKSNTKCSHSLCLSCCQMAQRVHSLKCKFKGHLYKPSYSGNHVSSPVIPSFLPFAQPTGSIPGSSQRLSIATTSGCNEVDLVAKSREAAKRVAALTIWIELWTKPGSSTLINAEAPNWPRFSLQESQIVLDKCRKAMHDTEDWQSEIQVWNMELFRWVSLAPTCTSKFPTIPRKLLVRLECISDSDCSGLSDAILKMTTEGPYEPLTTPARCILTKSPNLSNFNRSNSELILPAVPHVKLTTIETSDISKNDTIPAEPKAPDSSPPPSPHLNFSNTSKIKWIGSSMASKGTTESPKSPLKDSKSTWPDSRVLLGQIIRWYQSFQGKGSPRNAWLEFFGETYDYGYTTVYRVKNWIPLVGEKKLEFDVQATPSLTLIEARKRYSKEWLKTKSSNNPDQPKQKAEVKKIKTRRDPKEESSISLIHHAPMHNPIVTLIFSLCVIETTILIVGLLAW
ncbi:hypothetical protein Pst134EA_026864 [Puccinia striiformis f. sp. tritici]|uniref:hypothetical protein n=2 Tax=Puccinia striiformis f. sp. tritici TaxID=168172 RepID=UPI002008DD91|nr:hypothetical protein Pst134EA_026864 [Puccinia striiformis f. sp. tritici]KAH9450155.1 hypothetical protein Pst134EA_026864 [Puccinia striiformis f. sp. tritici]